jgi:hypothetical protein
MFVTQLMDQRAALDRVATNRLTRQMPKPITASSDECLVIYAGNGAIITQVSLL